MTGFSAAEVKRAGISHRFYDNSDGCRVELRNAEFFSRQRFKFDFALNFWIEPSILQVDNDARRIFGVRFGEIDLFCNVKDDSDSAGAVTVPYGLNFRQICHAFFES